MASSGVLTVLCAMAAATAAQDLFELPTLTREVPKPIIEQDHVRYYDLTGSARTFVDTLLGPRPGLIPQRGWDVAGNGPQPAPGVFSPQNPLAAGVPAGIPFAGANLPPGFNSGFSLSGSPGAPVTADVEGSGDDAPPSSVAGIPPIYPTLPKAPHLSQQQFIPPQPQVAQTRPSVPQLATRPVVPTGGLGPLANDGAVASSLGHQQTPAATGLQPINTPADLTGAAQSAAGQTGPLQSVLQNIGATAQGGNSNLFGSVLRLFGIDKPADLNLATIPSSLLGFNAEGGGQDVLSNVLYGALTDGAIQQPNGNLASGANSQQSAAVSDGGQTGISSSVGLIQQLITQPNSPFCNPKPQPVQQFDVDAFMGQWYQVLYSPPLSAGPCSMIAYKKLADVANGGPGTVFDTFEYTTEGTPLGAPRITSGYAIVRAPGQLIYRTTSSPSDVNVHIIETGPVNALGQYDYAVMSINCNYPLHVLARDPVVYKQNYEAEVNARLEQRGLVTGIGRLLNVVAPVDSTLCTFPPTLFNIHG